MLSIDGILQGTSGFDLGHLFPNIFSCNVANIIIYLGLPVFFPSKRIFCFSVVLLSCHLTPDYSTLDLDRHNNKYVNTTNSESKQEPQIIYFFTICSELMALVSLWC